MWGVGGHVDRGTGRGSTRRTTEGEFKVSLGNYESLLEVVAVRRRATPGRDIHVYKREVTGGIVTSKEHCVGVAHNRDVGQTWVVRLGHRQLAPEIIGRYRCGLADWVVAVHRSCTSHVVCEV